MGAKSYTEVDELFTDGRKVRVVIGGADRVLAEDEYGFALSLEVSHDEDERWLTHIAWTAYCRTEEAKEQPLDFEEFRRSYLGNSEPEDPSPEVSTPA